MAAADVEPSVLGVLEVPLLIVAQSAFVADEASAVVEAPVEDINEEGGIARVHYFIIAEVAAHALAHGADNPLLREVVVARGDGAFLRHVCAVGDAVAAQCHDESAGAVDEFVGGGLGGQGWHDVLAVLDVHAGLGVGLSGLVACAARQVHEVLAHGALAVVEDVVVGGQQAIGRGDGLAFTGASEGLHVAFRMAVDAGGCPVVAMLGVSDSRAAAGLHELTAGVVAGAPPDALRQSVLLSDHALHGVVQFVADSDLAVLLHLLVELGEVVEAACQLVGVSLVEVFLAGVVPFECIVVVEGVSPAEEDVLEFLFVLLVLAQFLADGGEVSLGSLVPGCQIRFVEWRDADDLQSAFLYIAFGQCNQFAPAVGLRGAVAAAIPFGHLFQGSFHLVGIEVDGGVGRPLLDQVDAVVEGTFLTAGECSVQGFGVGGLETQAHDVYQLFAGEVHAAPQVALADPGEVQSPRDVGQFGAFVADAVGEDDAVLHDGRGLQGAGAGGLREGAEWRQ